MTGILWSAEAVAHGELNRHDTTEAVHEGDKIGKVIGAHQAEVTRILGLEQTGLLIRSCILSIREAYQQPKLYETY